MTTFREAGDSVSGDKLIYEFGATQKPKQVKLRKQGFLFKMGVVRVVKRLRKPTRIPFSAEQDQISCETASYECDEARELDRSHLGAHRKRCGYLEGDAEARIVTPFQNIPKT